MIITFFRSSFLTQYKEMCEHSAFLTYTLGRPGKPSIKADMGSVTHLALEWVSVLCKQVQEGKEILELDNSAIQFSCTKEELYEPTLLTDDDVRKINKTRANKEIYLDNAKVPYGQVRHGAKVVNKLIDAAYKYFSTKVNPDLPWAPINYKHCWNWTWMTLEQLNRAYDPRFRKVIEPERQFQIEITDDWGKYEYDYMGKKLKGNLILRGTIDLLLEMQSGAIEAVDYKSGRLYSYAKDTPKTYEMLMDDIQLNFYYYCIRKLYPEYKNVIISIYFIRDGGIFNLAFDDSYLEKTEKMLKETFEHIKNNQSPKLVDPYHNDKKCKYFCPFFKKKMENGMSYCDHTHNLIKEIGMDAVVELETYEGFTLGTYENPGI